MKLNTRATARSFIVYASSVALIALTGFLSLSGCTVPPLLPDTTLLPNLNEQSISSADKARDALTTLAATRADIAYETRQAEIACYKVFYVNACLSNVDVLRKRKEARLREIDLISQQVIRNERTLEKNQSIAKSQDERESKAPADAMRREQSVEKSQDRLDSQAQKAADANAKQIEDLKKQPELEASRKAKLAELDARSAKAKSAQEGEGKNRAKYQGKVAATNAKQAKALEKQKMIAAKPAPAPRLAKPPRTTKISKPL
jgi:hypothetical protein